MARAGRLSLCLGLGLPLLAGAALPVLAEPPARVVSMNLCTDQLAMALAAPGQLVSVGYLARDPVSSAMAAEAAAYPANHGQAEEIALLAPDLVVAGAFGDSATVAMLERLGIPVARFAPETSIADIRANLREMGRLLGQEAKAEALIADMDATLDALAARLPQDRPLGAVYYAGGYTAGSGSLAGAMVAAAGIDNLAAGLGLTWGGTLSLEEMILSRPDTVIRGQRYGGHSRGEEMLTHPALAHYLASRGAAAEIAPDPRLGTPAADLQGWPETNPVWVCGTPLAAVAIAALAAQVHGDPALQHPQAPAPTSAPEGQRP